MNDTDSRMCPQPAAPVFDPAAKEMPRVLVAEDDPASCRFLADSLQRLGAQVSACTHGAEALMRARTQAHDLLLLDCRMPGAGAVDILSALRAEPAAACHATLAVATTADDDARLNATLLAAGFSAILRKPCSVAHLQDVLMLVPTHRHAGGVLDDGAGLSSSGDATTLRALRQLLRDELHVLEAQLATLAHDRSELAERLHRLRASCGFCGTPELAAAAGELQREAEQRPPLPASIARFRQVLQVTTEALDAQTG